ncbi:MAG: hypothetical protein WA982_13215 [Rubrobacteraceae bacterium]
MNLSGRPGLREGLPEKAALGLREAKAKGMEEAEMVKVKVEKKHGAATVRANITAPSIARAMQIAGPGAKLIFLTPTDQAPAPVDDSVFLEPAA